MASLGKIPVFSGEDYAYWKVRMRAFLQSMGADVWEITTNQLYEVLAVRAPPLQVTQHEANAKAVNALFAGVSRAEFSRVQGFQEAHKVWTYLENYHEGTPQMKLDCSRLTGVNTRISHRGRVRALATCSVGFNRL